MIMVNILYQLNTLSNNLAVLYFLYLVFWLATLCLRKQKAVHQTQKRSSTEYRHNREIYAIENIDELRNKHVRCATNKAPKADPEPNYLRRVELSCIKVKNLKDKRNKNPHNKDDEQLDNNPGCPTVLSTYLFGMKKDQSKGAGKSDNRCNYVELSSFEVQNEKIAERICNQI